MSMARLTSSQGMPAMMPWELSFRGRSSQLPLRPRRHRDDKHPFILLLMKIPRTIPHSPPGMKQRQSELAWQTAHPAQTTPMD
jgi:hypothetical protein